MKRFDLDTVTATLERLGALTAPVAVVELEAIGAGLPTCGDPEVLTGIARALPDAVAGLQPEVCLALHRIAA